MSLFLDTNVLVRHLTGEPKGQAAKATALLLSDEELILVDLVCAELVYVLESVYGLDRKHVAVAARAVLAFPSIAVLNEELLLRAVQLYETQRLHFAEAYLAAAAEISDVHRIASFDRALDRIDGVERVEAL